MRARSITARRQLRWIAWGTAFGAGPFAVGYALPFALGIEPSVPMELSAIPLSLIPLAYACAIVRYRLMDVEVIVKRALVYAAAIAAIVAIYAVLLQAVENGADLAIGSRYVPGGSTVNWPWIRKFISRGGGIYARFFLGSNIRDITAGFRAFRAETLRAIDFTSVTSRGYCFQIDLGWRTELAGLQVVEVPITFVERAEGDSKMSADITREAIVNVAKWGVTARAKALRDKAQGLLGR